MRHMSTPISGEIYNKLRKLKYTDLYEAISKILPPQYMCGYGVYDVRVKSVGDCYYIDYDLGDSCD